MDITRKLKLAFGRAVKNCGLSMEQICAAVYTESGIEVTPSMLYNYSSVSHPHVPRADIIPVVCKVTGCNEPLSVITEGSIDQLIEIHSDKLLNLVQTVVKSALDDYKKNGNGGNGSGKTNHKEVVQ
jgi:hypothetical protein